MHHQTRQAKNVSPKNEQQIIKGTKNKQIGIQEVTLETQQSEMVENEILD